MNEEIQFGLGLDTGPFFTGIRKVKTGLDELKVGAMSAGMALKDMAVGFVAGFVTDKLLEMGKAAIEFGAHIRNISEEAGVSSKFLQQIGLAASEMGSDAESAETALLKLAKNIGEAKNHTPEAVAAFEKWKIALNNADGSARSTEEVAIAISKAMQDIEDPTLKAAMATDLYGKSANRLVLALQELEKFKEKKFSGLTDLDLSILDQAEKVDKQRAQNRKNNFSKAMVGGLEFVDAFRAFISKATGGRSEQYEFLKQQHYLERGIRDQLEGANKNFNPDKPTTTAPPIQATKEYIAALRELNQANLLGGDKLVSLWEQRDAIQKELNGMEGDSVEKVKLKTELAKKENEILLERQRVATEFNRKQEESNHKQEEASQKQREEDERRRTMLTEIRHASEEVEKSNERLTGAKNRRYQLSIEELASSRFRFGGQLGEDQKAARQIKTLEAQGEWNRLHGFLDEAKDRYEQADKLRDSLSTSVMESDRHPFRELQESSKEAAEHLKDLRDKATNEGINVNPSMGK